jgi:hypothetical protein
MKVNKTILGTFALLVAVSALYRIIPGRHPGFAPQWAVALFAGAVIKDKKWALIIPILSLFISDMLYQVLYFYKLSDIQGFYQGQWINYLLFGSVTFFGFFIRRPTAGNVLMLSLLAPTYFFLLSNLLTWAGVGEFVQYPKTLAGLIACYGSGVLFYKYSLIATVFFSAILFGTYWMLKRRISKPATA